MTRREFTTAIKAAVIKRCMDKKGTIRCEQCHGVAKRFQIDHITPDGLLGEPVLANAQLICELCYTVKNAADTKAIAKAKRREAIDIGAKRAGGKIKSGGFPARQKQKNAASTPIQKWAAWRDGNE